MKILKRTFNKHFNTLDRYRRRAASRLSPPRALLLVEATFICCALLLLLTGSRAATLDLLGSRADLGAILVAASLLTALHLFVNHGVLARIDRRFPVRAYDERRILFDLGQAARGAKNINQIYEFAVAEIAAALRTSSVSIFVRDDVTGDYMCRFSSSTSPQKPMPPYRTTRNEVGDSAHSTNLLAADALIVKRLRGLGAPLGLTPKDLETWMRAINLIDSTRRAARKRECATLRYHDARLLLGITMQERLVGILTLGQRNGLRSYTTEDKRLLLSVANQLAFVIENAKLVERMVAEENLRRELALASEVQQRLLPASAPQSKSFELSAFCQPARAVGGDYYDFIKLIRGQTAIAVADVAGKGISAALLMSSVQASLRSQAMTACASMGNAALPADLVRTMNRLVYASTGAASYVTFFYAQFDEDARTLTYVNAGHNPPLLIRAGSATHARARGKSHAEFSAGKFSSRMTLNGSALARANGACTQLAVLEDDDGCSENDFPLSARAGVIELSAGGPVLGFFDDCLYEQETLHMKPGDLLLAYTDGLTESLNADGEEFGEQQLREALINLSHESADAICEALVNRVRRWSAGIAQHDDLTVVVMKVK